LHDSLADDMPDS